MFTFLKRLLLGPPPPPTEWLPLVRTAAQQKRHSQWVAQQVYRNWMGPFFKAYHFRKAHVQGQGLRVQLLREEGRQGALFFYDPSIGPGNFQHLFDFIGERVLALGYHVTTSDQRTLRHPRYVETIQKHFLKPQPKDCPDTGRCQQRFGTVTVDMVSINHQPGFIRFFSNPYNDAIFTPPGSFDELMEAVFHLPPPGPAEEALIGQYARA